MVTYVHIILHEDIWVCLGTWDFPSTSGQVKRKTGGFGMKFGVLVLIFLYGLCPSECLTYCIDIIGHACMCNETKCDATKRNVT